MFEEKIKNNRKTYFKSFNRKLYMNPMYQMYKTETEEANVIKKLPLNILLKNDYISRNSFNTKNKVNKSVNIISNNKKLEDDKEKKFCNINKMIKNGAIFLPELQIGNRYYNNLMLKTKSRYNDKKSSKNKLNFILEKLEKINYEFNLETEHSRNLVYQGDKELKLNDDHLQIGKRTFYFSKEKYKKGFLNVYKRLRAIKE